MSNQISTGLSYGGELPRHVVLGLPVPAFLSRLSDDTFVLVNQRFTDTYGLQPSDVEGRTGRQQHFVEVDRDLALERFHQGMGDAVEVRVRDEDGGCHWAEAEIVIFEYQGEAVLLTLLHDIGSRKQAEKALQEEAARVAQMARFPDMNPGPVVCVTPEGIVEMANQAARSLFGREALKGECLWEIIPSIEEETRTRVLEGSDPIQMDAEVGQTWLRLTLTPDRESNQIFVYGTDISDQRAAEQDIAERARFPLLNPGPVARLERNGTVLRANPAASRVFGRKSLTGAAWRKLCPNLEDSSWDRIFEPGARVTHEQDIGDRCFAFALRHEPELDQIFVYGSDVTEMKMAERALAELARFPDMNPGPVCRLDRSGVILLANPAARAVFETDDLTGQSWLEVCPGVDQQLWGRILACTSTIQIETKIGGRHYVMTHAPGP